MNFKVLWRGKFISVISPDEAPYEAVHEGDGVIIIPIIKNQGMQIGIREEYCPPYLVKDTTGNSKYYTLISGMIDDEENPLKTALREIKEEAGIEVEEFDMLYQKTEIPESKVSTRHVSIFVMFINKYKIVDIKGDGTIYESKSETKWVSLMKLKNIVENKQNIDFLLVSGFFILDNLFKDDYLLNI